MEGDLHGGIVTVTNWTMAPDGGRYQYFYCPIWRIMGEKEVAAEVGLPRIKSADGFVVMGYAEEGDPWPCIILPGCQFKALVHKHAPLPVSQQIYQFGQNIGDSTKPLGNRTLAPGEDP